MGSPVRAAARSANNSRHIFQGQSLEEIEEVANELAAVDEAAPQNLFSNIDMDT